MKKTKKTLAIALCTSFGVALTGQMSSAQLPAKKTIITSKSILKALENKDYIIAQMSQVSLTSTTPQITSTETILKSLQKGGYIIYFRHPQTNHDQADTDTMHLNNIKAQRQLSKEGQRQAKLIGEAFRANKIPIGEVLVSQYYRAQEAAKLAGFNKYQQSISVTEPQNVSPAEEQKRAAALRKILGTSPRSGTNTIIIAHRPNLESAIGKEFGDLREGEAVIFKPLGKEKFQLMGRVPSPEGWRDLSKAFSPSLYLAPGNLNVKSLTKC
jgi:phosphohistidine phosphatase SixA